MLNMKTVDEILETLEYAVLRELYPFDGMCVHFDINDVKCFCNLTRKCLRDKLPNGGVTTTLPHTINNQ